jgi:hypothetical protein
MPVDGRMPVVAAVEGGRQFPWWAASASLFNVWLM